MGFKLNMMVTVLLGSIAGIAYDKWFTPKQKRNPDNGDKHLKEIMVRLKEVSKCEKHTAGLLQLKRAKRQLEYEAHTALSTAYNELASASVVSNDYAEMLAKSQYGFAERLAYLDLVWAPQRRQPLYMSTS